MILKLVILKINHFLSGEGHNYAPESQLQLDVIVCVCLSLQCIQGDSFDF